MKTNRRLLTFCTLATCSVCLALVGCGSSTNGLSQDDYDSANAALKKALTGWKKGENPQKWHHVKAPIRFVDDDWRKGFRLVDFDIVELRATAGGFAEGIVKLSLKSGNSSVTERKALYGINVKNANQVVIGRDPMY